MATLRIFTVLLLSVTAGGLVAKGATNKTGAPTRKLNEEVVVPKDEDVAQEDGQENTTGETETRKTVDVAEEDAVVDTAPSQESRRKGDPKSIDFSAEEVLATLASGRERTVLRGNVRVRVNDQRMLADDLQIYGENYTILTGEGRVRIRDDVKKIYIEGSDFTYDRENKVLRIRGEISIEDQENEVIVRAAYLEYFEDDEVLNLQINVRVFNKDITTKSEMATYSRKNQTLELTGSPVVHKGSDRYESTLITVDLNTREVVLEGGATGVIETE